MLPRSLYELLPYLYLVVGVTSGLLIESSLILIASLLLVAAGLLTIFMRWRYREESRRRKQQAADIGAEMAGQTAGPAAGVADNRRKADRRQQAATHFPFADSSGVLVEYDRRRGERRQYGQQSLA